MGSNGIRVYSKEWDGDERAVSSQAQHGVAQLECGMVFVGIALVEVDIFKKR